MCCSLNRAGLHRHTLTQVCSLILICSPSHTCPFDVLKKKKLLLLFITYILLKWKAAFQLFYLSTCYWWHPGVWFLMCAAMVRKDPLIKVVLYWFSAHEAKQGEDNGFRSRTLTFPPHLQYNVSMSVLFGSTYDGHSCVCVSTWVN